MTARIVATRCFALSPRAVRARSGVLVGFALALASASAPAEAATFSYDFELTLISETVNVRPAVQSRSQSAFTANASSWVDLGPLSGDVPYGLGIEIGETLSGDLHLQSSYDFGLTLDGREPDIDFAFVTEMDPVSGDAALAFSTPTQQYDFDFIDGVGTFRTDDAGNLTDENGSIFWYLGYTAEFSLAPKTDQSARLVPTPLPAGPALLIAALGGLALMRRRRGRSAP